MAHEWQRPTKASSLIVPVHVVVDNAMFLRLLCPPARVKVVVERIREKKTTARQGAAAMKHRDIVLIYGKDKTDQLCARLKEAGRWYYDEEWPKDEDEIYNYVTRPRKLNVENITSEKASMQATAHIDDAEAMNQLTAADGVFGAGVENSHGSWREGCARADLGRRGAEASQKEGKKGSRRTGSHGSCD